MPTETQARELLHRAADRLDVGPPPVEALLASTARRRRRLVVTVAGVAAAGVAAAVALIGPGGEGEPAPSPPANTGDSLDVRPGMRLVGQGDIAVEVPESWQVVEAQCPMATTGVVFDPPVSGKRCSGINYTPHSVLHVDDLLEAMTAPGGEWLGVEAGPLDDFPDTDAYRTKPVTAVCGGNLDGGPCGPLYRGAVAEPAAGVVLWVESDDQAVVDQVLDSVRRIPDDYVAVPTNPTPDKLTHVGLEVAPADFDPMPPSGWDDGWWIESDPPPGTVVAQGTVVTLTTTAPVDDVTITRTSPACGPTDGPALHVVIDTARRYDVHVVLSVGDNVIGKVPTKIRPGEPTRVLVAVSERTPADAVTVQVFGLGMPMDESLLAQLDDQPLYPAPGCG